MLSHSRLKENILCAVLLFSKIVFFNRTTWLLSYQLHQLLWSLWWKTDLLLEICYAVKAVLNLTACLLSAGRGCWHVLYIQSAGTTDLFRAGSDTTFTSCWALHDGVSGSARWKMCVAALRCVGFLFMAHVDPAALILHCKVAWEFWVSA